MNCENLTVGTASGIALDVLLTQKAVVKDCFWFAIKIPFGSDT